MASMPALAFRGRHAEFLLDRTRLIDLEGSFRSGKTWAALAKVVQAASARPGVQWLLARWSDADADAQLRPQWRDICQRLGVETTWEPHGSYDRLGNGSVVYFRGLRSADENSRYAKIRGLTLAGVLVDQAEELPHDIWLELCGRLSQGGQDHQMIMVANPPDEDHWLAREFPVDQHKAGRRLYQLSVYDNGHNLPPETIAGLVQAYPPGHPKHRPAVLGQRGLDVRGEPVYGAVFDRRRHLATLDVDPSLPLLEAVDYGLHRPCVVWAQQTRYGSWRLLGGVLGQHLYLDEFAPILLSYRDRLTGVEHAAGVMTVCDPAGTRGTGHGTRHTGAGVLQEHGIHPRWREDGNAPTARLATIERIGGLLSRRQPDGEMLLVESRPERWLRASREQATPLSFVSDALEAGYVWDPHPISVGHKQVRRPKKDDLYDHGMNCVEYLVLEFGSSTVLPAHTLAVGQRRTKPSQSDDDPFRWHHEERCGRGGYR